MLNRVRVLLADDHKILSEGLAALLSEHFAVVGVATNGRELLTLAEQHQPDVIISDISMPFLNGLEVLKLIKKNGLKSKIIILTMHEDAVLAAEAIKAGANGYLIKRSTCTELIEAINDVVAGKTFIGAANYDAIQTMLSKADGISSSPASYLTSRQKEILQMTAEGLSMKEIAEMLKISPRTVETHKYSLMQKLGLKTTAELVQYRLKTIVI